MVCIHVQLLESMKNTCLILLEEYNMIYWPQEKYGHSSPPWTGLSKVGQERSPWTEQAIRGETGLLREISARLSFPFLAHLCHLPSQRSTEFTLNLMHSGMLRQFFKSILASFQVGSREEWSLFKDFFFLFSWHKMMIQSLKKMVLREQSIKTSGSVLQSLDWWRVSGERWWCCPLSTMLHSITHR